MKKKFISDIALIFVAVSWGATFIPVQNATGVIDVYSFLFWRFLLASILMFLISFSFGLKFEKSSIFGGLVLGLFLFCGFAFQTFALKFSFSSTVAFITGINVVIVPFLLVVFFKDKLSIFAFLGAFIALIGLYFISGASVKIDAGEILSVICAVAYALQIAFTGYFAKRTNIFALVIFQFITVSVLSLILAIFVNDEIFADTSVIFGGLQFSTHFYFIFAVITTTIFATVFAFFVQTWAQKYTSAAKTAVIFTLEPVSAGIIGYFFGEHLNSLQIFGAVLIIIGILISEVAENLYNVLIKKANKSKF